MAPVLVVVLALVLDHHARLGETGELLDVEQLVAHRGVKRLDERVCHGEPGSMYAVPVLESSHQSLSALAVISGPLTTPPYSTRRHDPYIVCHAS